MKKILIIVLVCVFSVGTLIGLNFVPEIPMRQLVYAGVSAFYLLLGSFILKSTCRKMKVSRFFRLRPLRLRDSFLFLWMMLAVISGSYLLSYAEMKLWELFGIGMTSGFADYGTESILILFLAVGLMPAVFEELFFRGAVCEALDFKNWFLVLLTSAFFFFLLHGTPFGSLSIIFSGLVFGILTDITGSIFSAMLAHLINNILSYGLEVYSEKLSVVGLDNLIVYALGLVFLISVYGALTCTYRKFKNAPAEKAAVYNEGEVIWEKRAKRKGED